MPAKAHLIKGDTVLIRRGKERGKRGTVKAVQIGAGTATVEGANIVKRHMKQGTKSTNIGRSTQTGGIIEKESPLPISALQYICEKCKAPTRLRRGRSGDGAVHRICARCAEPARESGKGG
jgi:large subunit ribosomal protein L24